MIRTAEKMFQTSLFVAAAISATACMSEPTDDAPDESELDLLAVPHNAFIATYYKGKGFTGPSLLQRSEATIDHDWGTGSPDPLVPIDHFSAAWEGSFDFAARAYHFTAYSDDGLRVFIDGHAIVDAWTDHAATKSTATVSLTAGLHDVRVEYYENTGKAVAKVSWDAPVTTLETASDFVSTLNLGINLERSNAYNMGDFATGSGGFTYLKNLGFTHVRLFYAFSPTLDFGQSNGLGIAPTKAQFSRILPVIRNANAAGLKVLLDLTDVLSQNDFANGRQALMDAYLDMASKAIAEANFDPKMLAVGGVNEWAGGSNASWNAQRMHVLSILRANLPTFILTTGSANWKYYGNLMASDFQMSTDDRVIYDFHAYEDAANNVSHWTSLVASLQTWSAAHNNAQVFFGEAGLGGSYDGGPAQYYNTVSAAAQKGKPIHPVFWAITNGSSWRMNVSASDYHLAPALEYVMNYFHH